MKRAIITICLFFVGLSAYAEAKKVTVRYADGVVIEGMAEKKVFSDGPIRIYTPDSSQGFEFQGAYQGKRI